MYFCFFQHGDFYPAGSAKFKKFGKAKRKSFGTTGIYYSAGGRRYVRRLSKPPLGIPYIISRYGSRHAARGILMWVANGDSVVYSSVENPADETLFTDFSEKRVSFVTDINGKKYFRAKSALTGDFRPYKTVIAFPLEEFYREWNDTVTVIMAVCRGVSLIVAAVLYLLLNRITKPIEELNRATIQFGKGNLQARVEHITDDEVGQTAENFNIMAGKICSQMETLENAAKEKQNFIDNFSHEMRTPLRL